MKKIVFLLSAVVILAGCSRVPSFTVNGTLTDAQKGDKVYLEHVLTSKVVTLDSVKLGGDLTFSFTSPRPDYPDVYRLRIGEKTILLAVDSLETIGVQASCQDVLSATFENSPKSEKIACLRASLRDNTLDVHKAYARQMILENCSTLVAYYALYQSKDGNMVFDITDKEDRKFYQAVATSWNAWMPTNPRTKTLYEYVLGYMNAERRQHNAEVMRAFVDEQENAFLDIVLPDEKGDEVAMSKYKGKVILLDFCSLDIESYGDYIFSLRERYNMYHDKGLEIYQVYPTQQKWLWKEQVEALPWTTVCAENGMASRVYSKFNVQVLPTMFLINRNGEIVKRMVGFKDLDEAIKSLL